MKSQAIDTPDELISHLAGPFEGKLGDWSDGDNLGLKIICGKYIKGRGRDYMYMVILHILLDMGFLVLIRLFQTDHFPNKLKHSMLICLPYAFY